MFLYGCGGDGGGVVVVAIIPGGASVAPPPPYCIVGDRQWGKQELSRRKYWMEKKSEIKQESEKLAPSSAMHHVT